MRSEAEVLEVIDRYADTISRICFYRLGSREDTEDVLQEVFVKYLASDELFESEEHRRAWLIRVTINTCKDHLKYLLRHAAVPLDAVAEQGIEPESQTGQVLAAVLQLPKKYRDVLYLHYYEGYSAAEVGDILGKRENTVYSLLSRGRTMLKAKLGGELDG